MRRSLVFLTTLMFLLLPGAAQAASQPPADQPRLRLRVLTLNIHRGINWYNQFDLEGLIKFIQEIDPDLIGLQEVGQDWADPDQVQDLPAELAVRLGMEYNYTISLQNSNGSYGNLILSKYPLVQAWSEPLPSDLEQRSLALAQVQVAGVRLNFATIHLGLSREERLQQAEAIVELLGSLEEPLLLVGDCNGGSTDPAVRLLESHWTNLQELGQIPGGTLRNPDGSLFPAPIDYIFASPQFNLESLSVVDNYLSDHLPVVAEVSLELTPPAAPTAPLTNR